MCGVAGVFRYRAGGPDINRDELDRITGAQASRGPDASGQYYSPEGKLGLAHRRLSIIDLDEKANQPLLCEGQRFSIVFNGEIYNYRELREELAGAGHPFATHSDTEVLLQAYIRWGEAALERLRGMYAFAIWDERDKQLFLARDPYGIKPLYYADDGAVFRFASQVKALVAGGVVPGEPDPAGVAGFLMMGSVPEPHTIYRSISSVPSGCHISVDRSGVSQPRQFFSVAEVWREAACNPTPRQAGELRERVSAALADTVRHHRVADVPVGAFLSAGIDSGALLATMSEQSGSAIASMTLGFAAFRGSRDDETTLSAEVARRYGSSHTTRWIEDEEVERDLPAILSAMDQPSIDGVNTWLVSKVARETGLKVVLSGVGGDELFGGYAHFDTLPRWKARQAGLRAVPGLAELGERMLRPLAGLGLVPAKAPAVLRYGESMHGLYLARRGLFMPWDLPGLVGEEFAREGLAALQPPRFLESVVGAETGSDFATIAALEASFYLRNQLLRDADWASMAHSLELRTPLVDTWLLRALAPSLIHRPPGMEKKRPLAAAPGKALPAAVVNRPKTGFSLPMQKWLDSTRLLDGWQRIPALNSQGCHWSRRMAYALVCELV